MGTQFLQTVMLGSISLYTLLSAVVVFIVCLILIKILTRIFSRALEKSKLEKGVITFIQRAIKIALWALAIVIVAGTLGIPTASLVAVISVAGLALSLSVQGIFSNVFSGITVFLTRPFKSGDFVEVSGMSGTVKDVGLFHTTILTIDNKLIYVPNSEVTSSKIVNYSSQPLRRVDLTFCVSYDNDVDSVKAALLATAATTDKVLDTPAAEAHLLSYKENTVEYVLRAWCNSDDYWDVYFALNENVSRGFARAGVKLSYSHVNVHMVQ